MNFNLIIYIDNLQKNCPNPKQIIIGVYYTFIQYHIKVYNKNKIGS